MERAVDWIFNHPNDLGIEDGEGGAEGDNDVELGAFSLLGL